MDGDDVKHDGHHHAHTCRGRSLLASGGRHRHHEHHARERDGAYKGDRTPHERRGAWHRHQILIQILLI